MSEPSPSDKDLIVTWSDYCRAIEGLALMVHDSGWQFDQILCLARGGLLPGDILSRIFQVPLAILSISSYREEAGRVQGQLNIARHITTTNGSLAGNILLVDDLADTGHTLQKVRQHLQQNFAAITAVKSAVIWCKASSVVRPDFYLEYLSDNPWIRQPFEEYDHLRPYQIAEQRTKKKEY